MFVRRYTQVVRPPDVHTEFRGVIAPKLGDIADHLPLFFVLIEGAVTPAGIVIEAPAPIHVGLVSADSEIRQPAREIRILVEIRNPCIGRGRRPEVTRKNIDLVLEPPEAEIGKQGGRNRVIHSVRETLVARV